MKLPPAAVVSIVISLGDRTAGMAALEAARAQVKLSDRQVLAANLAAKAPSSIQFFLFSFIPLMIALFPGTIAVQFLTAYFLAFCLISLIGIALAWLEPYWGIGASTAGQAAERVLPWRQAVWFSLRHSIKTLANMAGWMFVMSFAAMLFVQSGLLSDVIQGLPFVTLNLLPVFAAGLLSMVGGVAAAGAAYQAGAIDDGSVVKLLFIISMLHNVYDLFAAALPRYIAIYGRKLGMKLALYGFALTQSILGVAAALL
ncbi:MAG: hypothetical protein N2491_13090 [Negativicutes bacterium]|nr:hypothetical protein [Negativicutes bacterium]